MVEDFKEWRVYQRAFAVSMKIFEVSKDWPPEEKYSLTDQIRRSSRSVCSNIAEAWFKRSYEKHFASKLSDAVSEAGEAIVWLDYAKQCGTWLMRERISSKPNVARLSAVCSK
jgi:four helix bundle protein